MRREELQELHYIVPIATVLSILANGILSHDRAAAHGHEDISMKEIQDIRANRAVAPGRMIHSYANVYFNARNAMMYKRKHLHSTLCVLRISPDIIDLRHAMIADQNGGSNYARFHSSPAGLANIDRDIVMAASWIHEGDERATWRHKAQMCAEVLIPDSIPPTFVTGAYVSGADGSSALRLAAPSVPSFINPNLFFQGYLNA